MRIYYKIWMSQNLPDADILSFAFCSEKGNSLYVEANDYNRSGVSHWHHSHVVRDFLGPTGFKDVVPQIPKLRAAECGIESGKEKLAEFLDQYKTLELISRSGYYETQALLWLTGWERETRHVNVINISKEVERKHIDLLDGIREELPDYNALRHGLFYKHIGVRLRGG